MPLVQGGVAPARALACTCADASEAPGSDDDKEPHDGKGPADRVFAA